MTHSSPSGGIRLDGAALMAPSATFSVVRRDASVATDGTGMNIFCLSRVVLAVTRFLCSLLLMAWSNVQALGFISDDMTGLVPVGIADNASQQIRGYRSDRFHITSETSQILGHKKVGWEI